MADLDRFDSALSTMERSKVPLTASVLRGVLLSAALTGKAGQCRSLLSPPQLMRQHRVLITAWSRQAQGWQWMPPGSSAVARRGALLRDQVPVNAFLCQP